MRVFIIFVTILIGLSFSACSPAVAPSANAPSPASTRPSTIAPTVGPGVNTPAPTALQSPTIVPTPSSTVEPLPPDVLAIYHKRGCFQGLDETLLIHTNGTLTFTDTHGSTQEGRVNTEQLATLQALLDKPGFAQLQPLYQAMGADLCVYTVTAQRNGQPFSVTTMDGAETPEFLQQVLQEIERLDTQAQ